MAETVTSEHWVNEPGGGRRFALALLAGMVIELIAFGVLLPVITRQKPPPSNHQSIVKLSVIAPAPQAPPAPPPPKPIPPPPKPVVPPPVPVPPPPPMPVAPPVPVPPPLAPPHHMVTHRPPPRRHAAPPRVTPPVQQPPPVEQPQPPAAAPAAPSAGELDLFQAEMRRAVQAAAVNPASAELAHEAGVVRLSFIYQDGVASGITVIASSGFPLLDQAAIQAVRNAQFPPQPPDFAGRADQVVVDVIFRAAAADIDGD
jgi:protein TonB